MIEQIHPFKSGYVLLHTRSYGESMSINVDIYPSCYDFSNKAKENFKTIISNFMDMYGDKIKKGNIAHISKNTIEVNCGNINIIEKLREEIKTFLFDLENYCFDFKEKTYLAPEIEKNGGKVQFIRKTIKEK
jgi:hypothetical protein